MATVFQPLYTKRARGRVVRRRTRCWYARYLDPATGKRVVRPTRSPDRLAAEQLAARWERDAHRRHAGLEAPADDPRGVERHVADYLADLAARGRDPVYCRRVAFRLGRLAAGLGWQTLAGLDAAELVRWLAARRGPRFGATTANDHLTAAKVFTRWLVRERRLARDPFAALPGIPTAADRRRVRRALTAAEFARLVAAARARRPYPGSTRGPRRAALYVLAAYTGLRASELASLTPESFALDATPPTVTVAAAFSKRRREDTLPLHPAAVEAVREVLAATRPGARLWPGCWARDGRGAELLRGDLAAAGLPFRDAQGRVCDFHALRSTYVTNLARAGVPLQTVQKLARHSTPALTANCYTVLGLDDLAAALARLPAAG